MRFGETGDTNLETSLGLGIGLTWPALRQMRQDMFASAAVKFTVDKRREVVSDMAGHQAMPFTADPMTAERLFDRRWALTLLDRVLARLGGELTDAGKAAQFEALKFCLSGEKRAYAEVALRLGMTEGAVKVAAHRLRERYRALVRAEIAETVGSPEEVDAEMRDLFAALSG